MKSCRCSGPVAWVRSTAHATRGCGAMSLSRSSPAELSENAERLRRFEQEARAAAALNHPNILAVFDVGSASLESTDSRIPSLSLHYLVTELLEGETLRARLERGPLLWRKAVEIIAEVAQGLAAAHTKGIVHRDVKPANIFLTADGRVKILDFGLAKLREPEGRDVSGAAMTETDAGRTVGTVAYMSPEQAAGRPVDARSDLFALGCVLYEMVGGSRPFRTDDACGNDGGYSQQRTA